MYKFSDIIGQDIAVGILRNSVRNNRYANAYIFHGSDGVGKQTTALAFAAALNCLEKKDDDACGVCEMCHRIEIKLPGSVTIVEPEKQTLSIDQLRDVKRDAYLKKTGGVKVYIVKGMDKARKEASNSILKILEEPPANTVVILLAENYYRLLPTIRSRSIALRFRQLGASDIAKILIGKYNVQKEQALTVARSSSGSISGASKVLDGTRQEVEGLVGNLTVLLKRGEFGELSRFIRTGARDRKTVSAILECLLEKASERLETLPTLASQESSQALLDSLQLLRSNVNPSLVLESLLLTLNTVDKGLLNEYRSRSKST